MSPVLPVVPSSEFAARLCAACGLCCNGVMFHTVRLQPTDSPPALTALGLKLKRKRGEQYLLQPCPAFCGSHCAIYAARPERCRLFECRQLQAVAAGQIGEADALEKIREAQRRVEQIDELMHRLGATNPKRPLAKRCEKALAEPCDTATDPAGAETQRLLTLAMQDLEALLDQDFRVGPGADSPPICV